MNPIAPNPASGIRKNATPTGATRRDQIHFSPSPVFLGSKLQRFALLYARIALGATFLCVVGSRFGIWQGEPGMKSFPSFLQRTAQLNFFMPAASIPFLAWSATILEIALGLTLVLGGVIGFVSPRSPRWLRWVAAAAAILLAIFATTMTLATGIKAPLDYSVFSASACALLLAVFPTPPTDCNSYS